jgi:hypothetical protein
MLPVELNGFNQKESVMKIDKIVFMTLLIVSTLFGHEVWARGHGGHGGFHGHPGFGLYFGTPFYSSPFYPYPYYRYPYYYPYYNPPVVTVPATPPVYIQQSPPATRDYPSGYWYYCSNPEGYYPYIKECPDGWQQVDPTPPASR